MRSFTVKENHIGSAVSFSTDKKRLLLYIIGYEKGKKSKITRITTFTKAKL